MPAVAELDDTLLAARWARAVRMGDVPLIAACEVEAEDRGTTISAILAATNRQKYRDIAAQSAKNKAEGKSWDTGQRTLRVKPGEKGRKAGKKAYGRDSAESKGSADGARANRGDYVPARKKAGNKGGGQFTSPDDPEGTGGKGGSGKGSAGAKDKEAEKAARAEEKARKGLFNIAEDRREAEEAIERGEGYGKLISHLAKLTRAYREAVEFAKTDEEREKAQADLRVAEAEEADARAKAEQAKTAKTAEREAKSAADKAARTAESEAKAAQRKTEREAESAAKRAAREAEEAAEDAAARKALVDQYPQWEADVRDQYKNTNLSEAELEDLILRDRARRANAWNRK